MSTTDLTTTAPPAPDDVLAFWSALDGGTYRITAEGNIECWQNYANAWLKCTSLVPHVVGTPGHYEGLVSAINALQRADAEDEQ